MNWQQLETFYMLADQGSVVKTAKLLSVHPTTVTRRISDIEKHIGTRLLNKSGDKYVLTIEGIKVFEIAKNMARQARYFNHYQESLKNDISGIIRISATESFISSCLISHTPKLIKRFPGLNLKFISGELNSAFNRRETDLAIRFYKPSLVNVVISKIGDIGFSLYAKKHSKENWTNFSSSKIDWVTYYDDYLTLPEAKWICETMKNKEPIIQSINSTILKEAIKAGLGIGILPCYIGDTDNTLVRISGPKPVVSCEAWLLMHDDFRNNSKICHVIDWIKEISEQDKLLLNGHR